MATAWPAWQAQAVTGRIVIAGAGGRDFHDFNTVFRDDPEVEVVAFTATQIPGIDRPALPAGAGRIALPRRHSDPTRGGAGRHHPGRDGRRGRVLVLRCRARRCHAPRIAGAGGGRELPLLVPARHDAASPVPVVAVVATRTGAGKSPTTRRVARILADAGLRVALVRHPMPYGDLARMRVQRFATLADIDAASPTIEEREEYEEPVRQGMLMFAGVDYAAILDAAAARGRRHRVGRRQQRHVLLRSVADDLRHRPVAPRRRHQVPPRRDQPATRRRGRRHQGRRRRRRCRRRGHRRHADASTPMPRSCVRRRPSASTPAPTSPGRRCWSSRTARRSPMAAWPSARARWLHRPTMSRRSSTPAAAAIGIDRCDLRSSPPHRARPAGDGVRRRPTRRPRRDGPRRRVRRGRHRDADRPGRLVDLGHPTRHVRYRMEDVGVARRWPTSSLPTSRGGRPLVGSDQRRSRHAPGSNGSTPPTIDVPTVQREEEVVVVRRLFMGLLAVTLVAALFTACGDDEAVDPVAEQATATTDADAAPSAEPAAPTTPTPTPTPAEPATTPELEAEAAAERDAGRTDDRHLPTRYGLRRRRGGRCRRGCRWHRVGRARRRCRRCERVPAGPTLRPVRSRWLGRHRRPRPVRVDRSKAPRRSTEWTSRAVRTRRCG